MTPTPFQIIMHDTLHVKIEYAIRNPTFRPFLPTYDDINPGTPKTSLFTGVNPVLHLLKRPYGE
jgi:hypothetical protein